MKRLIYVDGLPMIKQNKRDRQLTLDQQTLESFISCEESNNSSDNSPHF